MNAWGHLPNAHHIDWVLASARAHPDQWTAARAAAWAAARAAAQDAVWDAARGAARDAALDATQGAAPGAAQYAAWSAAAALVAWDDCDYLFVLPEHAVRWLASEGDHAAVLLLPMCTVKQQEALSLTS